MAWTDDRVELVKKLWMEGLSASQIANRMGGVTRNAVIGKVHRLGLSGRATTSRVSRPRTRKPRAPSAPGHGQAFRTAGNTALKSDASPAVSYRPEPKPSPLQEVHIPPGERIGVLQLSDKTCRWPIGDPSTQEFHFCGRDPQQSQPYCAYHTSIAYQPLQDRRRQKRVQGGRR